MTAARITRSGPHGSEPVGSFSAGSEELKSHSTPIEKESRSDISAGDQESSGPAGLPSGIRAAVSFGARLHENECGACRFLPNPFGQWLLAYRDWRRCGRHDVMPPCAAILGCAWWLRTGQPGGPVRLRDQLVTAKSCLLP
jgi:hypothetical protein